MGSQRVRHDWMTDTHTQWTKSSNLKTEKIYINPKEGRKGTKNSYIKQKTIYKMVGLNPVFSISALSVNALNPTIKRQ